MTDINFKSENPLGDCSGILFGNLGIARKGLIVLQEWWGITDEIKRQGKQFAEQGPFITLVPDLYRGKVTEDYETAGHMMNTLDWTGAVADVKGAAQYLLSIGCTKIGVTGFCMGGALSLAAAALLKEISAAAPFYGIPNEHLCDITTINIPVQAHFGENDPIKNFSSKDDALLLKLKQRNNTKFELHMYANCGHAFIDPTYPAKYNQEASVLALGRVVTFMNKWLADNSHL